MNNNSTYLKVGTPEIRVGLTAAKKNIPMESKSKKSEMPKDKKRLIKMPKRAKM
jgi:hypothetical protein